MYGFTESYNISVSCAIILSNMMFRLRETKKKIALNSTEKELLRLEGLKNQ